MNPDNKYVLDIYETNYKLSLKKLKWGKIMLGLNIFNILSSTYNITIKLIKDDFDFIFYFNLIIIFLWIYLIYTNFKQIKTNKLEVNEKLILYEKQLKIIDYPKYIKEQRTKKLMKLKKAN